MVNIINYLSLAEVKYNMSVDNPHKPFFWELNDCEKANWVSVVISSSKSELPNLSAGLSQR